MRHDAIFPFHRLPPEPKLLDRYLAGECTAEEAAGIRAWAGASPSGTSYADEVREACRAMASGTVDVKRMEQALLHAAGLLGSPPGRNLETFPLPSTSTGPQRPGGMQRGGGRQGVSKDAVVERQFLRGGMFFRQTLRRAMYVVSSLAVAGVIAVIAFSRSELLHGGHRLLPVHTYTTTAGQHTTVTLADGSHAQLGPMTTLVVTNHTTARRVEVHVTGEALFSVTHRPNTSFQVRTANVVTHVLGTRFLVRRYPKDHMTQIVVAEGRVALASVHRNTQRLAPVLTTRMLGTVDDSGHVSVTPNITIDDYTGWTTGQLVFHNTPIRNVVAEVGRAYNVEIRIVDSVRAEQRCNWTVPVAQQSLADILELLGDVLEAHPVRAGGIITFIPGRATTHRSPHQPSFTPERQYGK